MILIAAFLLVTKQTLSTTTTWQFFRDWNSPTKLNSIERSSSSREVDDEGDWMEAAEAGRMLPPRLASVQKGMPHCWLLMLPNMINRGVSAAAGDTNQRSFSVSSVIFLYYFRLYCVGSFGLVFCSVLFPPWSFGTPDTRFCTKLFPQLGWSRPVALLCSLVRSFAPHHPRVSFFGDISTNFGINL